MEKLIGFITACDLIIEKSNKILDETITSDDFNVREQASADIVKYHNLRREAIEMLKRRPEFLEIEHQLEHESNLSR